MPFTPELFSALVLERLEAGADVGCSRYCPAETNNARRVDKAAVVRPER